MTARSAQPSLFDPAERDVPSVSELVARLRQDLEQDWPELSVRGEISNLRVYRSGHCYFTLKDETAQLRVVMFRSQHQRLRFALEDGLSVVASGSISVYEPRGDLQLLARRLEPLGDGALRLAFEQLKQTLAAEGLFDTTRKRTLPLLPRRIGIVTSPDGAAVRDILQVLTRRWGEVQVLIAPTRVQGEGAAAELRTALAALTRVSDVDVVIITRGGGSLEDLWAFNDEQLARAVAACAIPVISAVGHETDVTIIDLVADLRAPTPSAAAELVLSHKLELTRQLRELARRLHDSVQSRLGRARVRLARLEPQRALRELAALPARRQQRLDELAERMRAHVEQRLHRARGRRDALAQALTGHHPGRRLARRRESLARLEARQQAAALDVLTRLKQTLARRESTLEALSPFRVLERGYSIASDSQGRVLREAGQVEPGGELRLRLARGRLRLRVLERQEEP